MGVNIAFWVLAILVVGAALAVVTLRNVFRAALSLILCFVGVAGIYITLSADFLAVIQVLVYVGGISVLVLLAIMLTRNVPEGSPANRLRVPAFLMAAVLLGIMVFSVLNTTFPVSSAAPLQQTTGALGQAMLDSKTGYILPIEIAGVLLLSAVLGAIVMAREK
jgi:NADH-quinone oxidoreductase subunit J